MLTADKQIATFIIRSNLVRITLHQCLLRVEQTHLTYGYDVYFCELREVGTGEEHLFNSIGHIYNYLTSKPECIIQIS